MAPMRGRPDVAETAGADNIELDPAKAMEGTRHLVLFDVSRRLLLVEQEIDYCDAECDRALLEVRRLLKWVEGRLVRNGAFGAD
jgi:hypothetical protein